MVDEAIVTTRVVLVATWRDGLFVVSGENRDQELGTQSVRALAPDRQGGALAIVNGRSLRRRAPAGVWSTLATTEMDSACCVAVGDLILRWNPATTPAFCASARTEDSSCSAASTRSQGVRHGMRARPSSTVSAWDRRSGFRPITATPDGAVLPRQRPRRRYPSLDRRRRHVAAHH